ncbi:MAG: histidine kinase, partial [Betaproteobacteria bacterium]
MLCWLAVLPQTASAIPSGNVLVLYSNNRLLPANVEFDQGLSSGLVEHKEVHAEIFSEFLDAPAFKGAAHEQAVASYLHEKYSLRPPAVIIAGGEGALNFALRFRDQLFPGIPV